MIGFICFAALLKLSSASYCLCSDIISQSVCDNPQTYAGICKWRNGQCQELTCPQRMSLATCQPEFGSYYCGWKNDTFCVNPTQCSDLAVRKWCLKAGCSWTPNSYNQSELSTQGSCTGDLGQIRCENLDAYSCKNVEYIFDFSTYQYNYCLYRKGQCQTYQTCSLYQSEYNCISDRCKWNKDFQQCQIKQCSDMTSEDTCLKQAGDEQTPFMCQWNKNYKRCQATDCSQIQEKSLCNHQSEGYGNFCYWIDTTNQCQPFSCSDQTDQSVCMHNTFINGGHSTCTWILNPSTKKGQCYACDNGVQTYKSEGGRITIFLVILSLFIF